ncbi:MAG: hypothetical protein NVSMB19_19020 [Vulcanimicrobiaceae bacterium]
MIRCVAVSLVIPDNEARTALATLQRLGVGVTALARADLYRCDVESEAADLLLTALRGIETVFNPNKHAIRSHAAAEPGAGEVWVDEAAPEHVRTGAEIRIAGRTIPGLRDFERFTAWRLETAPGVPAGPAVVAAATDLLLCNPAFQKAIRS